jgi:hypothetical protein
MLTECGLVVITQFGRERYCEARLERLGEVADWVEQYRKMWMERFDNQANFLDEQETRKKPGRRK